MKFIKLGTKKAGRFYLPTIAIMDYGFFILSKIFNYPISIPFSTALSSGVTKDNLPSGFVVSNSIP